MSTLAPSSPGVPGVALPSLLERLQLNPWAVTLTVTLATFMEVLDTSIANVALPHIAGGLSVSEDEATWVLTSYLVANAIVLPLSAWLSIVFSRKRFYMGCVVIFTLSSALCGLAPSLGMLIVCRVLQGAGGGGLQPSEQAILADTFTPAQRGMAFAVYGVAVVSAPALRPTLGGWITDNFSWRWVFLINVPVGIVSLVLTRLIVRDSPHEKRTGLAAAGGIDAIGLLLIAVGLGALQVMLDKGQQDDWFASRLIVTCAVLAVVGIVGAIVWELRQRQPIVDIRLLANRNFATAFGLMFALGFVLMGSTVLLPLYLQTLMGYSAMQAGMSVSAGALTVMALMPVVGWLVNRVHARWLIGSGLLVCSYGLLRLSHLNLDASFAQVSFDRVVQASGIAFLFVPINTVAYSFVPPEKNNSASSLINLARNVGGSVGISVATTMLARRAQMHQSVLTSHVTPYDAPYRETLARMTQALGERVAHAGDAGQQAMAVLYESLVRQAHALAFLDVFRMMAVVFALMVPVVLMIRATDARTGQAPAH